MTTKAYLRLNLAIFSDMLTDSCVYAGLRKTSALVTRDKILTLRLTFQVCIDSTVIKNEGAQP